MEQNENNGTIPVWIKIVNDFPAPCQQSIGNLCAQVVQNLSTIALISAELFVNVCKEVVSQMHVYIDADLFVKNLIDDALKK